MTYDQRLPKRLIWGRVQNREELEHPRSVVNLRAIFKKIFKTRQRIENWRCIRQVRGGKEVRDA